MSTLEAFVLKLELGIRNYVIRQLMNWLLKLQIWKQCIKKTRNKTIQAQLDQILANLKLLEVKLEKYMLLAKQRWFQGGNKPGKLLANLLVPKGQKVRIPVMVSRNGADLKTEKTDIDTGDSIIKYYINFLIHL